PALLLFFMPPPPPSSPLFPYTTLFRSIDPTHSFINFSISHLGFSFLQGRFNDISGSFVYDADNPRANSITVEVKTASIDSNHAEDRKSTRLNSSHVKISYAVFCLKKKT